MLDGKGRGGGAVVAADLVENIGHVGVDRLNADKEDFGNLAVGGALCD